MVPSAQHDVEQGIGTAVWFRHPVAIVHLLQYIPKREGGSGRREGEGREGGREAGRRNG